MMIVSELFKTTEERGNFHVLIAKAEGTSYERNEMDLFISNIVDCESLAKASNNIITYEIRLSKKFEDGKRTVFE